MKTPKTFPLAAIAAAILLQTLLLSVSPAEAQQTKSKVYWNTSNVSYNKETRKITLKGQFVNDHSDKKVVRIDNKKVTLNYETTGGNNNSRVYSFDKVISVDIPPYGVHNYTFTISAPEYYKRTRNAKVTFPYRTAPATAAKKKKSN